MSMAYPLRGRKKCASIPACKWSAVLRQSYRTHRTLDMKTYFLFDASSQAIKVGKSRDPMRRLRGLQTGNATRLALLGVIDGDHERRLHRRWTRHHIAGEWFRDHAEIRWFIHRQTCSLAGPVETESTLGNTTITHWRHLRVMHRAYAKYQEEAILGGMRADLLCDPVPLLSNNSVITAAAHQQHLALARRTYEAHLMAFFNGTVDDTHRRTRKVATPRLVPQSSHT